MAAGANTLEVPKRWPLVVQPGNRDTSQRFDAKLINGYAEKDKFTGEVHVYKRLGLSSPQYIVAGNGRGMFLWIGDATIKYVNFGTTPVPPFNTQILAAESSDRRFPQNFVGYSGPGIGTATKTSLGSGVVFATLIDTDTVGASLSLSGFSADPKKKYFLNISANGVTLNAASATYSYASGRATWSWNGSFFGFVPDNGYPVVISFDNSGSISVPVYASAPILILIAGTTVSIVSQGATPVQSTLGTIAAGGMCRFCQINAATALLLFGDGTNGAYYTDGTTITQITDPNFPTSTVPGFVILDGTIYVMTPLGQIYGSKSFNDPSTWDPLNLAVAGAEGDIAVYLAKQLTYVVAMKQWTIQFFYDAANPSGSPLSPIAGAIINYGCLSAQTVQDIQGRLFFVSSSPLGTAQVAVIDNMAFRIISTPAIDRLLEGVTPNTPFHSFPLQKGGHTFYVLSRLDTRVTMVHDLTEDLWQFWLSPSGSYWPIVSQAYDLYGNTLLQDEASGAVYATDIASIYPNDNGATFPVDIYAPSMDFGTKRIKMLSNMYFSADQTGGQLQVRFTDDDYQSWSNFQHVDMGHKRPMLPDQGSFTKRAYHFRYNEDKPFRIRSVDLQMDLGTL